MQSAFENPNGYAVLITLIGALAPVLATIVTYILTKRQSAKVEQAAVAAVEVTKQGTAELKNEAATHSEQLGQVKVLVNGRLTAALEEIKALQAKVAFLEGRASGEPK